MEEQKKKKIGPLDLMEKEKEILTGIESLQQKLDAMDKNNKKFLMAATMNDGRTEYLEKENVKLKKGIIDLLDQFDVLFGVIDSSGTENMKKGMNTCYNQRTKIIAGWAEEIPVGIGEKFDPKEQECVEIVHEKEKADDTVAHFLMRGYKDKKDGSILRYARVTVNRLEGKE